MTSGCTPQSFNNSNSPIWKNRIAGCDTSISSITEFTSLASEFRKQPKSWMIDVPLIFLKTASHFLTDVWKTGSVRYNLLPIAPHCCPWPGNMKQTFCALHGWERGTMTPFAVDSPFEYPRRALQKFLPEFETTAIRKSWCIRRADSHDTTLRASIVLVNELHSLAKSSSAFLDLAEKGIKMCSPNSSPPNVQLHLRCSFDACWGDCSNTAWARAPANPKLLSAILWGDPPLKSSTFVATWRLRLLKSMLGLGFSKFTVGQKVCFSSMSATLMAAVTPAAHSLCPKLPLTDPILRGVCRWEQRAFEIARASMGSPTGVPVPCAST